jgi:WhiB family redox-sensing transcriptional regulator
MDRWPGAGLLELDVGVVLGWRVAAACGRVGSTLFFGPERELPTARRLREHQAKEICGRCPVVAPCRAHALARREQYGIWGGLSERDRAAIWSARDPPRAATDGSPA